MAAVFRKHSATPHRLMLLNEIINSSLVFLLPRLRRQVNKLAELQNEKMPTLIGICGFPFAANAARCRGAMIILCVHNVCENAKSVYLQKKAKRAVKMIENRKEPISSLSFQRSTITIWSLFNELISHFYVRGQTYRADMPRVRPLPST